MAEFRSQNAGEVPFLELLLVTEMDSEKLMRLKSRPDLVVRVEKIGDPKHLGNAIERHARAREEFGRLRKEYGFHIPDFSFVVGKNDAGELCMFTVVEKISAEHGASLSKTPKP